MQRLLRWETVSMEAGSCQSHRTASFRSQENAVSMKSKTDGCLDAGDWLSSGCREQREGHQRQKGMFSEPSVDWDLGFIP